MQSAFVSLFALASALALTACRPNPHLAEGVELVQGSDSPTPGMTFELRFGFPMVRETDVGLSATNSPLIIRPPLAGKFTWLSARSGVFTPSEPLALDTRYELTLQSRLLRADGAPAQADLRWTLATPPFGPIASWPLGPSSNAFSEPEIKLAFNADVSALEAGQFLSFRDDAGRSVPVEVRQGTVEDASSRYGYWDRGALRTWLEEFAVTRQPAIVYDEMEESATNTLPNLLVVSPRRTLPLGKGWKLVLRPGLHALGSSLRTREVLEVPIGDVTPFVVSDVEARHFINSGALIRIDFSKPVPDSLTNDFANWISVTPVPTNLQAEVEGTRLILRGAFHGGTAYEVQLRAGLHAAEPFQLSGSNVFTVRMPHIPPRIYFPAFARDQLAGGHRSLPLLGVNVSRVRVRAKLLEPQTAIHALHGYGSYFITPRERPAEDDWDEPYRSLNYNLVAGRTVFDRELPLADAEDNAQRLELSWDKLLAGRMTGVVFLEAERVADDSERQPRLGVQALIQLTDLGLVWKCSRNAVDVFVFSHRTGQPVPGAAARLYSDENEPLQEALTDECGVARLRTNLKAGWVAAQRGEDFHALPLSENRVWQYHFDLPHSYADETEDSRRVLLFSDRDLYRPGEEMHFAALVREWAERGLAVPAGVTNTLSCLDARGRLFFKTNGAFSHTGAWSTLVPLPIGSRGAYSARLQIGTNEYTHSFQVADFQPSAFELELHAKSAYGPGEPIAVPLSGHYFFGKNVSHAQVKWSLEAEDLDFRPERFGNFTFRRADLESKFGRGRSTLTLSGQGTLTESNPFLIAPELPINPASPQPRIASLLAEVTDLNQQTVSRRAEFVRHSSDFYLGLRQGEAVLTADCALTLEAVAVGAGGAPWPETVKARLKLQRVDWETIRVQGAGRAAHYRNETVFTNLFETEIDVPPIQLPANPDDEVHGKRLADLPALPAGQYLLSLAAEDAAGRPVHSSLGFEVSAPAALSWNYRNDSQLALKPARKVYTPGDTAEILVEAPFGGTALVSIEREKVLRSIVTRLEGNAPLLRVPLVPGDVPNVAVSVTLLRGSDECTHEIEEPEYRVGYCDLTVEDPQTRLKVTVDPGATNYLPGQPVETAVSVADANGQAVAGADIILYAVDDGILSLTDYGLPDPYNFFYAPRPLGVISCVSLPNLLEEDPEELRFENKGYLGGGGGKEEHLRKNFLACAFWTATASTDASGRAIARFPAPDSLTRYRVFAVAHTAASQFGSGQAAFQVAKPLILEPALPNFANLSDRLIARGVIHNQTPQSGAVEVTLQLDDKAIPPSGGDSLDPRPGADPPPHQSSACLDPSFPLLTRRIAVPANGSAAAEFPVEFIETGEATWIWKAKFVDPASGKFTDAVQSTLEVGHVVPLLREVLLSRPSASQTNLLASANPQLLAGRGAITVTVANTRLTELAEAAAQLLHYPYGCAEQTGSSLLPWLVLRDSTNLLARVAAVVPTTELPNPAATIAGATQHSNLLLELRLRSAIRAGIARLFSMQTQSGGLGYWPRANEPMLWASAYGGMVLALAQRDGADVPAEEFGSLLEYLSRQLRSVGEDPSARSDACLALYALALAGRPEPAYHEKFFASRERLSDEDRALLALAVVEARGPARMSETLLRHEPSPRQNFDARFGCLAREQATRLLAWLRLRPGEPLVDRLVDDLMRGQTQAHWGTTQGDAWALLALSEYARLVDQKSEPAEGQLRWQAESIAFHLDANATNLFSRSFPFTNVNDAALELINPAHSRFYTSVLIEARPAETFLPRQDRGFGIERRYDRLDDDNQLQDARTLHVGDRVLVTLRLVVHDQARYVAVDDALPSVLEAVNPEFRSQAARSAAALAESGSWWVSDFRELRKDRCLAFANWIAPGNYTLRYVARVRASGTATAPPAKVEEMYHPERCGLSGSQTISSEPLP